MATQPEFPGIGNPLVPRSDEDWFAKRIELSELFSPSEPVREADLFAGRSSQLGKLVDAVYQGGQHAIVYGERGVGKSSLVNVFRQKVFSAKSSVQFFPTKCFHDDDFKILWGRALESHQWNNGDYAIDDIDDGIDPYVLLKIVRKFGNHLRPTFIFDEFDRIIDEEARLQMAETIKLFSDEYSEVTVIIIGVGHVIGDLISDHQSVRRALRQIEMPRLTTPEIKQIIEVRLPRVGMAIDSTTLDLITTLARGMPGYAHLLGMHSAKAAIEDKALLVSNGHLWRCLKICIEEVEESTRRAYSQAIQSAKPGNKLREALLGCALAVGDEFGRFTAASLREPLSGILGKPRDIPDFARYLTAFCSSQRGPVLEKTGTPKNYMYKFIDPLIQSYVIMRCIEDDIWSYGDSR